MDSDGNGQPVAYTVAMSGRTKGEIVQLHGQALQMGEGAEFLSALRCMYERLRDKPLDFGEPLYHLDALKLTVKQAILEGIVINFAVHDDLPLVIIRSISILS